MQGNVEHLPARRLERGGSEQTEAIKRRVLQSFADRAKQWMGDRRVTPAQLGGMLNTEGRFNAALREARVNMRTPIMSFVRAFPDIFEVRADAGRIHIEVLRGALAFQGAQRLRRIK